MSKESKPADRWQQVHAAAADRPATWCRGCGYYRVVHGVHRGDCLVVTYDRPASSKEAIANIVAVLGGRIVAESGS